MALTNQQKLAVELYRAGITNESLLDYAANEVLKDYHSCYGDVDTAVKTLRKEKPQLFEGFKYGEEVVEYPKQAEPPKNSAYLDWVKRNKR